MGLEGHGGLERKGEAVLMIGGDDPMSVGVSAGLRRSGDGPADSIENLSSSFWPVTS